MTIHPSRRQFIQTAATAAAGAAMHPAHAQDKESPNPMERPNIVFIFSDQQRWDTVHCYGNRLDMTPNLDQMARDGIRFEHAFTCQPVCGPARSCLQTGRYALETGCWRNDIALPLDEPTIARMLSAGGYEVGYIGKWHLASTGPDINHRTEPVPPEYRGGYKDYWLASDVLEFTSHAYDGHMFDGDGEKVMFPKDRYRVDCLGDFAIDYLRTRDRKRPFFLFLSFIEPHHQNDMKCFQGPHGSKERFKDYPVPGDLEGTDGDWRENYPDYLGACAALDTNVGRIRAELEALGLAENTLVIYTSDHGCHFRTRNGEYKRSCHDGSLRVPMMAVGPGFEGGKTIPNLVSLIDLPPTVLAAAHVDVPSYFQGRPLQQLADGTATDWPDDVFAQISEAETGRAVRTKDWKYSVRLGGLKGHKSQPQSDTYTEAFLYDLEADPCERNNLIADPGYADIRSQMRERLLKRMRQANEPEPEILPAT